jgi:hypothetical protein
MAAVKLHNFREELRNGHRCVHCASTDNVLEIGACGECLLSEEEDEQG